MNTIENNNLQQFASAEFIPTEEINSVILKAQAGDKSALKKIVKSCQYLILNVAKKSGVLSCSKGYEDDIISSGNIGLLVAIRNFNISKGIPFIPYAKVCISGSIYDFLNSNHQIHYSKKAIQDLNKLSKKGDQALFSAERKQQLSHISYTFIPLFTKNGSDEEFNVCDSEGVAFTETPETQYIKKQEKQLVLKILSVLSERERFIITKFFGINCTPLSFSEIGSLLNISKQRVCQIYQAAIKKIKQANSNLAIADLVAA
jgi:RNA polymerase primary sigma factor